jgi:hypothetical protein
LPTVERSAYLDVCASCGYTARIVFSDGSYTSEVLDKADAKKELENGLRDEKLTDEEALVVREQIKESFLFEFIPPDIKQALFDTINMDGEEEPTSKHERITLLINLLDNPNGIREILDRLIEKLSFEDLEASGKSRSIH